MATPNCTSVKIRGESNLGIYTTLSPSLGLGTVASGICQYVGDSSLRDSAHVLSLWTLLAVNPTRKKDDLGAEFVTVYPREWCCRHSWDLIVPPIERFHSRSCTSWHRFLRLRHCSLGSKPRTGNDHTMVLLSAARFVALQYTGWALFLGLTLVFL